MYHEMYRGIACMVNPLYHYIQGYSGHVYIDNLMEHYNADCKSRPMHFAQVPKCIFSHHWNYQIRQTNLYCIRNV